MSLLEFLQNHTFSLVSVGVAIIGISAAIVGAFIYLRGQAPLADVVSHSALPGALVAFLAGSSLLQEPRNLLLLTIGAFVTSGGSAYASHRIARITPLTQTASMALVATTMFACGMLILAYIQRGEFPDKGGLTAFLFGSPAQLTKADVQFSGIVTVLVVSAVIVLWPWLQLATFDRAFAVSRGINCVALDQVVFFLLAAVIVTGMRTVGLLLIVGFALLPVAAARQWVKSLRATLATAVAFTVAAAVSGSYLSITVWQVATAPLIILLLTGVFIASILFAPRRGLVHRYMRGGR